MSGTAMAWSPASRREGRRKAAGPETDGHRMAQSGRAVVSVARHPPKNGGLSEDVLLEAAQEGG